MKWSTNKKEYYREYYRKHPEQTKKAMQKYLNSPKGQEKRREYRLKYNQSPRGIYSGLRNRGKEKVQITREEFVEWYRQQEKKCYYCGISEELFKKIKKFHKSRSYRRLEIDRKDSSQPYKLGNIVLACRLCNAVKNEILTEKEMKKIAQKYIKPKWQNYV